MTAFWNFLHDHFDKLLLAGLICVFLGVLCFSSSAGEVASHAVDTLVGALVGIITGRILSAKAQDPPKG